MIAAAWTFLDFEIQVSQITVALSLLALALWVAALIRDRYKLFHNRPLSPGVRDAAFVSIYGVLICLMLTSLTALIVGSGDLLSFFSIMTRGVLVMGGAYALTGTFVSPNTK